MAITINIWAFLLRFCFRGFIIFIGVGVGSLQDGYARKKEGIYEVGDIVLGFILLFFGTIVLVTAIIFAISAMNDFYESLRKGFNRNSTEETRALVNYLSSIIYQKLSLLKR